MVIDTETTGVDLQSARIVELGAAWYRNDSLVTSHGRLINPEVPIPAEASAIHGITDELVAGALTLREAAPRFLERVRAAPAVAGYNILHFDAPLLAHLLGAAWTSAIEATPIIDVLVMVRSDRVGRYWRGSGRHRLSVVAERYGIRVENAHRAEADCRMCGEVLFPLWNEHFSEMNAHELAAWCAAESVVQQRQFEEYLARQARKGATE
jgi:DNA polymerase III epsilon subunit-like protein